MTARSGLAMGYAVLVEFSFEVDVEARCAKCGVECEVPEGVAARVLQTDEALYAEVPIKCACGSNKVRVQVSVG